MSKFREMHKFEVETDEIKKEREEYLNRRAKILSKKTSSGERETAMPKNNRPKT